MRLTNKSQSNKFSGIKYLHVVGFIVVAVVGEDGSVVTKERKVR